MRGVAVAGVNSVVADFSLRQKERGINSAKTMRDVAVAEENM